MHPHLNGGGATLQYNTSCELLTPLRHLQPSSEYVKGGHAAGGNTDDVGLIGKLRLQISSTILSAKVSQREE